MARNVEVKIRVDGLPDLRARALALGAVDRGSLHQIDTYFETPAARGRRLKLREHRPGRSELIAYHRPDVTGLRTSDYHLVPVDEPAAIQQALGHALGVRRQVIKTRQLLELGRTRIHLDRVEGLGDFLELEVILREGDDAALGEQEAEHLLGALGLADRPRLPGSYADL